MEYYNKTAPLMEERADRKWDKNTVRNTRQTCAVLSLRNGMDAKELAQMLGHARTSMARQNYTPYLPRKAQKDEDLPNEATQGELQ